MAVSRKAMTEGIRTAVFPSILNNAPLQSLSQKSKIFASSLYTREPLDMAFYWYVPRMDVQNRRFFHLIRVRKDSSPTFPSRGRHISALPPDSKIPAG